MYPIGAHERHHLYLDPESPALPGDVLTLESVASIVEHRDQLSDAAAAEVLQALTMEDRREVVHVYAWDRARGQTIAQAIKEASVRGVGFYTVGINSDDQRERRRLIEFAAEATRPVCAAVGMEPDWLEGGVPPSWSGSRVRPDNAPMLFPLHAVALEVELKQGTVVPVPASAVELQRWASERPRWPRSVSFGRHTVETHDCRTPDEVAEKIRRETGRRVDVEGDVVTIHQEESLGHSLDISPTITREDSCHE